MPNDSLFVYGSMPFYIHVGDIMIVMYASDQQHCLRSISIVQIMRYIPTRKKTIYRLVSLLTFANPFDESLAFSADTVAV